MTIKEFAYSKVGCPYIYGGTGSDCTPSYRLARIKQYPSQEANITNNCQYLKSKKSCDSCKWYNQEADKYKPSYDCAQFTRRAYEQIGVSLVSGATSQWTKTNFIQKGKIENMPPEKICMVFRGDGKTMSHVGLYLGNGEVIHAANHKDGVVNKRFIESEWNYYGIPVEPATNEPPMKEKIKAIIDELNAIVDML